MNKDIALSFYRDLYGPISCPPSPHFTNISIYFFCSLKHEKEGECGDLPAMGIPTEPKDELSITYSYSVSFMVSSSNSFILFTFFVSWGTKLSTGRGDYSCGDYIMGNTVMGFVLHVWVEENLESLEI